MYIRVAREKTPVVTTVRSPFAIGKAERMYDRNVEHEQTVGIIVTGTLLGEALYAADMLNRQGIGASVLHMPTIKPLDTEALTSFLTEHEQIVTVEEHQIAGGLGGTVCEFASATVPRRITRIGVDDVFGQSGTPDELMHEYGMDRESIMNRVQALYE